MNSFHEDFSEFCAPGVHCSEERLEIEPGVNLRLITFTPSKETGAPAVLFIPGWISLMSGWKTVLVEMTKTFPVYYLETREKNSAVLKDDQDQGIPAYRDDILRTVDILGLAERNYILFGSSLGATAILDAHRILKNRPLALVLVGPNAEFRIPGWGVFIIRLIYPGMFFMVRGIVKQYLKWFRLNTESDRAQYDKYCRALDMAEPFRLKKAALALKDYTVWDLLPEIDTATLVIGGNKDKLHEPENLLKMTEMLPRGVLLDMKTNTNTHSAEMVHKMVHFLEGLSPSGTIPSNGKKFEISE